MYRSIFSLRVLLLPLALVSSQALDSLPSPIICLDTLDGQSRFRHNDIPCLLGCGTPLTQPTEGFLPGHVNTTDIPYCQLNCVHRSATPQQSARAPDCNAGCETSNGASPENMGWCMFWCVNGYSDVVHSTTCVPSLVYGDPTPTVIAPDLTITQRLFTQPPQFVEWLETQTVLGAQVTPIGAPLTSIQGGGDSEEGLSSSSPSQAPSTLHDNSSGITTVDAEDSASPEPSSPQGSRDAQQGSGGEGQDENENQGTLLVADTLRWPAVFTGIALIAAVLM